MMVYVNEVEPESARAPALSAGHWAPERSCSVTSAVRVGVTQATVTPKARERALQGNRPTATTTSSQACSPLPAACFSSLRNTLRHPSSLADRLVILLGVKIAVAPQLTSQTHRI